MLRIPYGVSNFEQIRTQNFLYVDKTHFIQKVEAINCLIHLRPRRFGKSLFLNMLDCYYDLAAADKFDTLFKGLYVHENPTNYMHSYYMLRLHFSGIQNTEMENLEQGFLRRVKIDAEMFINRYKLDIQLADTTSPAGVLDSLLKGFKALGLKNKIYILIDEYDHFTNSLLHGDAEDFLSILKRGGFVRSFYEVIKEGTQNGTIERIFITGVMSVTLDSMTSGFNIATKISTDKRFSDVMGFTADEVKEMLKLSYAKLGQPDAVVQLTAEEQTQIYEIFRENYNGYLFSGRSSTKVFNSTLIMYYLQHYLPEKLPPENLVDMNLNQSGTTIDNIVGLKNREDNYSVIEEMINEKQIGGTLQPFINIDEKFDKNDLITLLFNIGLLTIKGFDMLTQFEIPNKIIENIYLKYLSDLVQRQSDYRLDISKQQQAIIELGRKGELNALTALVSEFLTHTSSRNTMKFDEKYIKLVYMMILTYTDQFNVYDEFPVEQGFCDLFIQKAPNSTARHEILIELKYIKKGDTTEARIEEALKEGIVQIEKYMGDERLANRESLKKFVVVFSGFDAVRLQEL